MSVFGARHAAVILANHAWRHGAALNGSPRERTDVEFLILSLIVVVSPGAGAVYTLGQRCRGERRTASSPQSRATTIRDIRRAGRAVIVVWLIAMWVLLWGDFTLPNLLTLSRILAVPILVFRITSPAWLMAGYHLALLLLYWQWRPITTTVWSVEHPAGVAVLQVEEGPLPELDVPLAATCIAVSTIRSTWSVSSSWAESSGRCCLVCSATSR